MSNSDHSFPALPPAKSIGDILVVCSANMCRSPMAEALLRATLHANDVRGIRVHSAGTIAIAGTGASADSIKTCANYGLDISFHRSTPLTAELVRRADIVLVMENKHRNKALELRPDAAHKVFLISDFATGSLHGKDLPDPIGTSAVFYDQTFQMMQEMINNLVQMLMEPSEDGT